MFDADKFLRLTQEVDTSEEILRMAQEDLVKYSNTQDKVNYTWASANMSAAKHLLANYVAEYADEILAAFLQAKSLRSANFFMAVTAPKGVDQDEPTNR